VVPESALDVSAEEVVYAAELSVAVVSVDVGMYSSLDVSTEEDG